MSHATLPNFLVIGPSKAGTTSLFHYLRQHPEIYLSPIKNPKFFYDDYEQVDCPGGGYTLDDHQRGVPYSGRKVTRREEYERLFEGWNGQGAAGEISPGYLTYAQAAQLIYRFNPHMRMIAVLRDPVARAYSNYTHLVAKDVETRPFLLALEEEPVDEPVGVLTQSTMYVREGLYFKNLTRFFNLFQRDQLLICWFDELASDPETTLRRMFSFLGVHEDQEVATEVTHNVTRYSRSGLLRKVLWGPGRSLATRLPVPLKSRLTKLRSRLSEINSYRPLPLTPDSRAEALRFFSDDTVRLQELLGVDLSEWLE